MTKGKLSRMLRLSGLAAKISTSYLASKVQDSLGSEEGERRRLAVHVRNAQRIAETLGDLKGLVMKFGQMLSIQADLFPGEVLRPLAQLQQQAAPVPYAEIGSLLVEEFGAPPEQRFASFERQAFRSASIGQVHRARTLDGREVVVKVQYPGIVDMVQNDLDGLKLLVRSFDGLSRKTFDIEAVYKEVRQRIQEELDYTKEANNLRRFTEAMGKSENLLLPAVLDEYSTSKVLTLSYLEGDDLDTVMERYTQEQRDRLGWNLLELIFRQCLEVGLVHADPHPGNFLFRPDGRIAFLDFGSLKVLPEEWRLRLRTLVRAIYRRDYETLEATLASMGAYVDPAHRFGPALLEPYVKILNRVFHPVKPFDFGVHNLVSMFLHLGRRNLRYALQLRPISEMVLIDRMILGQYSTLRRLGARGVFGRIVEPYLPED